MRVNALPKARLLVAALMAGGVIFSMPAMAAVTETTNEPWALVADIGDYPGLASAFDWITEQYRNAPALVLGFAVFLAVPALVLLGALVRFFARGRGGGTQTTLGTSRTNGEQFSSQPGERTQLEQMAPTAAWIELGKGAGANERERVPVTAVSVLRLGREADNDITLPDKSVHRYHAAIHRSAETGFLITDLSSAKGNGVLVNGKRVGERWLKDGDRITLGRAELTFHARPHF